MKLKIVSNGNPKYTDIINAETGEKLENVTAISWSLDANGMAQCTLRMVMVPVELTVTDPECVPEPGLHIIDGRLIEVPGG